jgi:hypothetical protein
VKRRREIPAGVILDHKSSTNEDDAIDSEVDMIISEEAQELQRRNDRLKALFSKNRRREG